MRARVEKVDVLGWNKSKNPSQLELVSMIEIELEVEWTELSFRNVLFEDSEDMCTTS